MRKRMEMKQSGFEWKIWRDIFTHKISMKMNEIFPFNVRKEYVFSQFHNLVDNLRRINNIMKL